VAVFVGEKNGAPATMSLYSVQTLSGSSPVATATKAFFKADKVTVKWNPAGSMVSLLFLIFFADVVVRSEVESSKAHRPTAFSLPFRFLPPRLSSSPPPTSIRPTSPTTERPTSTWLLSEEASSAESLSTRKDPFTISPGLPTPRNSESSTDVRSSLVPLPSHLFPSSPRADTLPSFLSF